MKLQPQQISRRMALIKIGVGVGAAVSLAKVSAAAPAPHLDPKDSQAAKLGYVESALNADGKRFPSYAKGQTCENCLQLQGTAGEPYRPCTVFPGKLVAAAGWCGSWTPEI